MHRLRDGAKVVGTHRLTKAVEQGKVQLAYVAKDADLFISRRLDALCQQHGVPIVEAPSMKALGEVCRIEVPAAAAGLLK